MRTQPVVLVHGLGSSFEHGWRSTGWVDLLGDARPARDPRRPARSRHRRRAARPGRVRAPRSRRSRPRCPTSPRRRRDRVLARCADAAADRGAHARTLRPPGADRRRARTCSAPTTRTRLAEIFEQRRRSRRHRHARCSSSSRAAPATIRSAIAACLRRPSEPFTPADAARVTCPTLVIIGDHDFAGPPEPLVDALPERAARRAPRQSTTSARRASSTASTPRSKFVEAVPPPA